MNTKSCNNFPMVILNPVDVWLPIMKNSKDSKIKEIMYIWLRKDTFPVLTCLAVEVVLVIYSLSSLKR